MTIRMPFDLEYWIGNVLLGIPTLLSIFGVAFIVMMGMRFGLSNGIIGLFVLMFSALFGVYTGSWYLFTIIIGGIVIFWAISRAFSR